MPVKKYHIWALFDNENVATNPKWYYKYDGERLISQLNNMFKSLGFNAVFYLKKER